MILDSGASSDCVAVSGSRRLATVGCAVTHRYRAWLETRT